MFLKIPRLIISRIKDYLRYDYIDMGLGIAARQSRNPHYWSQHLNLSRQQQQELLRQVGHCRSALILGAGRLLDVPLADYAAHCDQLHCVDNDPLARRVALRQLKSCNELKYKYSLLDLTFSIADWTHRLSDFLSLQKRRVNLDALAEFLFSLEANKIELDLDQYEIVVSLNLLSQIPIYWRDRCENLLNLHWELKADQSGKFGENLEQALDYTQAVLQKQHLAWLAQKRNGHCLLIYDQSFLFYQCDRVEWEEQSALFFKNYQWPDSWQRISRQSWFWHIAPQHVEQPDYGSIHDVVAEHFRHIDG